MTHETVSSVDEIETTPADDVVCFGDEVIVEHGPGSQTVYTFEDDEDEVEFVSDVDE